MSTCYGFLSYARTEAAQKDAGNDVEISSAIEMGNTVPICREPVSGRLGGPFPLFGMAAIDFLWHAGYGHVTTNGTI